MVAATTSLVLIALLVPLALLVRTVAESGAVARATGEAAVLVAVAVGHGGQQPLALAVNRPPASRHPVTVFLPDGGPVSAARRPAPAVSWPRAGERHLARRAPGGSEILVAVQGPPGGTAWCARSSPTRTCATACARPGSAAALGLVLIGVGIVVADRLAQAVIRPMTATARVSHRLAAGDLSARAVPGGPPEAKAAARRAEPAGREDRRVARRRSVRTSPTCPTGCAPR